MTFDGMMVTVPLKRLPPRAAPCLVDAADVVSAEVAADAAIDVCRSAWPTESASVLATMNRTGETCPATAGATTRAPIAASADDRLVEVRLVDAADCLTLARTLEPAGCLALTLIEPLAAELRCVVSLPTASDRLMPMTELRLPVELAAIVVPIAAATAADWRVVVSGATTLALAAPKADELLAEVRLVAEADCLILEKAKNALN